MEQHLSYEEQLLLFKQRGVEGIDPTNSDFNKQIKTLKVLGYYKLKQYAIPFWNKEENKYQKITYNNLVKRYYRDQQLKQAIFQSISDIETALNNEISYILGRDDPYLYLTFEYWCQTRGYNRHIGSSINKYKLKNEELKFLSQLQKQVRKSNYIDIQKFESSREFEVFPPIWLSVNTLTFGQSIYLVKLMKPQNKQIISKHFFHQDVNKLINDLELLNLIRNICCHNGDLVDISLKTMPKIPARYKQYLNMNGDNYPHKLAVVILILIDLMYSVNEKYNFKKLQNILVGLCKLTNKKDAYLAKKMGFKNIASISGITSTFKNPRITTFYPKDGYIYN